jgi:hypothetical protein
MNDAEMGAALSELPPEVLALLREALPLTTGRVWNSTNKGKWQHAREQTRFPSLMISLA